MLELLNIVVPSLIAFYKELRDANPNQPALTDEEIIGLLRLNSQDVVDKARAWLAAHPPAPP